LSDLINIGSGVSGIAPYMGGNSSKFYNQKNQKKNNPQFAKFRQGEILQGLVIEDPINNVADVRIPIGIFKAELHGNLLKGDKLFFKIEETNPNLILKIHSVSLFKDKSKLVPEEILRILDLPIDEDFIQLCTEYSHLKSQIARDDILICYKTLNVFARITDDKQYDIVDIRNSIFLTDFGINVDNDIYKKFREYFENKENYIAGINQIKHKINSFEPNLQNDLKNYLNINSNSSLPIKRLSVVV